MGENIFDMSPAPADSEAAPNGSMIPLLEDALKFIFTGIPLAAIAVIISGKLISQTVTLQNQVKQLFQFVIPKVIRVSATDDEVILGFTAFILTLATLGLCVGSQCYVLFKSQFGFDPGQFNALCIMSSFLDVGGSLLFFLASSLFFSTRDRRARRVTQELSKQLNRLSQSTKEN